jgi:polar amino acid transport system ATP-binding protein
MRFDDTPAVKLQGVCKSFGSTKVLDNVNIVVREGQKLAIIGPSGSGKTTLLRLLMTLERPESGTIEIEGELLGVRSVRGRPVRDSDAHLRKVRSMIGMVFQQFNLFPHMTAIANIMVGPLHVLGMPRTEARQSALELLDKVGLSDKADAYPRELSGGQQQRVAIARALAMHPKIMLFDEITSALDPELIGEVLKVVRDLSRETNITMLIVTHEMSWARDVSDRVIFMDHGAIEEDASPDVIFTNPTSERTRAFLSAILER